MAPREHSELTSIKVHFQTLWVDVMDATFSTSIGTVQPYGQAMDCQCRGDKRAHAMVDLQGTGFAVDKQKVDLEECIALCTEPQQERFQLERQLIIPILHSGIQSNFLYE